MSCPITLLVLLSLIVVISMITFSIRRKSDAVKKICDDAKSLCCIGIGGVSFLSIILLVVCWIFIYSASIGWIANLEAFFNKTSKAYEYSITATEEIEIEALKDIKKSNSSPPMQMFDAGEFAYFKLAPTASERIKEFRDKIEWYNRRFERIDKYNKFWLTGGFIKDIPKHLKPIMFK